MFWLTCTLSVQRGRGLVGGDAEGRLVASGLTWCWWCLRSGRETLLLMAVGGRGIWASGSIPGNVAEGLKWAARTARRHWGEGRRLARLTLVAHFPPLEVEHCVVVGLNGHVELDGQNSLAVHFARTEQVHSKHWRNTHFSIYMLTYIESQNNVCTHPHRKKINSLFVQVLIYVLKALSKFNQITMTLWSWIIDL